MKPVSILKLNSENLDILVEISQTTFYETFAAYNTDEDINLYLSKDLSLEVLRNEMNVENSHFYFAYLENELTGYLKLNKFSRELEIERIYVLQKFQGKKIGLAMMKYAFNEAKASNVSKIWLGVWEHNKKAIEFYTKLGFQIKGEKTFLLGNDKQRDLIMELLV
jgi:ribosomal protein S18 acetylase RimI-like enzyme